LDQFKVPNGTADAFGVLPDGNEVLFLLFDRSKLLSYPAKAHLHPGDRQFSIVKRCLGLADIRQSCLGSCQFCSFGVILCLQAFFFQRCSLEIFA